MRTTVRLDDALFREAKKHAAERGTTLTALFEEALREKLARRREAQRGGRELPELPTFAGNGPRPGIDLHDTAELLNRMDGAEA